METDNMKLAWKELNDRINMNALANKKTLSYILNSQRKTAWQKLILADKSAVLFLFLMGVVMSYLLFIRENHEAMLLKVHVIGIIVIVFIFNCICLFKLSRISWDGSVLDLCKQVSPYKRLTGWIYVISYGWVIVLISFLIVYSPSLWVVTLISLILPVCIIIDYFIFRRTFNLARTLIDTTKELKELEKWNEQI